MSSRPYIVNRTATSQPTGQQLGDEWFDPATNILYKTLAVNGNTVVQAAQSVTTVGGQWFLTPTSVTTVTPGLTLLNRTVITTAVTEVAFSMPLNITQFYYTFDNVRLSTATNGDLGLQISTDGGASYVNTAGAYRYTVLTTNPGTTPANLDLSEPQIKPSFTMRSGGVIPASGWGYIFPGTSSEQTQFQGVTGYQFQDGIENEPRFQFYAGATVANTAANFMRFFMTANTLATGVFSLYAMA